MAKMTEEYINKMIHDYRFHPSYADEDVVVALEELLELREEGRWRVYPEDEPAGGFDLVLIWDGEGVVMDYAYRMYGKDKVYWKDYPKGPEEDGDGEGFEP